MRRIGSMPAVFSVSLTLAASASVWSRAATPRLHLPSAPVLRGEPIEISMSGITPGDTVRLVVASAVRRDGWRWRSWGHFVATADGRVDVGRAAPVRGSWSGRDPSGPFWSGEWMQDSAMIGRLPDNTLAVSIDVRGMVVDTGSIALSETDTIAVDRIDVQSNGVIAHFHRPRGARGRPAVLVLGGSEGGYPDRWAQSLAARGWPALAVAYFGVPGTEPCLVNVPLERFDAAARWLASQPEVDSSRLAVLGGSKGAEGALRWASDGAPVRAVAAFSPAAYVKFGLPFNCDPSGPLSSWSRAGQPLPFIPADGSGGRSAESMSAFYERSEQAATADLQNAARIRIDAFRGELLVVAGDADELSNTASAVRQLDALRRSAGQAARTDAHIFSGAGHDVYGPAWRPSRPAPFARLATGGSAEANAIAQREGWVRLLHFLRRTIGEPRDGAR